MLLISFCGLLLGEFGRKNGLSLTLQYDQRIKHFFIGFGDGLHGIGNGANIMSSCSNAFNTPLAG